MSLSNVALVDIYSWLSALESDNDLLLDYCRVLKEVLDELICLMLN